MLLNLVATNRSIPQAFKGDESLKIDKVLKESLSLEMSSLSYPSPPTVIETSQRRPTYQSDIEIFDFTDSRFIRPTADHVRNFPTLDSQEIVVDNTVSPDGYHQPSQTNYQHYQSFPTNYQVRQFEF